MKFLETLGTARALTTGQVGGAQYDAEWPERAPKNMW